MFQKAGLRIASGGDFCKKFGPQKCFTGQGLSLSFRAITNQSKGEEMNRLLLCLVLLLAASGLRAQESPASDLALFDSALVQRGLPHADIRFDQDEMALWGGDQWRLSFFTLLHKHPFRLPTHGKLLADELLDRISNPRDLLATACRLVDHPINRGLVGDPLEEYIKGTDSVPASSITHDKNVLTDPKYHSLNRGIDLIYNLANDDEHLFKLGLNRVDNDKYRRRLFDYFVNDNSEQQDLVYEMLEKIDMDRMLAGAQDFAEAARQIADSTDPTAFPVRKTEIKTRKGLVVIGSLGDDVYEYFNPPLLIIDGGGNDTYRLSGYPNDYPATILIDLAGDDRYVSTDSTEPGIAGAILGLSIVIDKAGNDRYESLSLSQGTGVFGVGMLLDLAGDDVYLSRLASQGMGTFGVGVLSDVSGKDSLYCLGMSQGFGYTQGCGLLINGDGDDRYVAEDDSLFNPSSQTREHNSSLAQGVGFGRRADYIDGHSWAGGVGVLCDGQGDDTYAAGLFAQGCAYWYAVGMLLDRDGADRYNGVWYVQGSGAHFGVGLLDDAGGDDVYTATNNMAIGAGHDFSLGYLNDRGGNDTYNAPNLSLGGGNANGMGIFHDHSGNDTYNTSGGITLGRANGSERGRRRLLKVFGLFVDGGGTDSYKENWAANGSRWIGPLSKGADDTPGIIGVGIDR